MKCPTCLWPPFCCISSSILSSYLSSSRAFLLSPCQLGMSLWSPPRHSGLCMSSFSSIPQYSPGSALFHKAIMGRSKAASPATTKAGAGTRDREMREDTAKRFCDLSGFLPYSNPFHHHCFYFLFLVNYCCVLSFLHSFINFINWALYSALKMDE